MKHSELCKDCEHRHNCRMVQEEIYQVGGKEIIIGVCDCDFYEIENTEVEK